jgi:hypothetical protein
MIHTDGNNIKDIKNPTEDYKEIYAVDLQKTNPNLLTIRGRFGFVFCSN